VGRKIIKVGEFGEYVGGERILSISPKGLAGQVNYYNYFRYYRIITDFSESIKRHFFSTKNPKAAQGAQRCDFDKAIRLDFILFWM
jgi:hypothetical protein